MKHAALATLAVLFWPIQGTTHGWVFSTIMLAAIWQDYTTTNHARKRTRKEKLA